MSKDRDTPKKRFCFSCETHVIATENLFNASGHVADFDHAHKKYKLTQAEYDKIENNRKSGNYDNKVVTIHG